MNKNIKVHNLIICSLISLDFELENNLMQMQILQIL